jgi:2-keto-4-pentenoate hydratase/2-oxohepta-3-ene-1,7-dioic acid hydratase in catechol pathway
MAEYRILNYKGSDGEPQPGISVGDRVLDLKDALKGRGDIRFSPASTLTVLAKWSDSEPVLEQLADEVERDKVKSVALSSVKLMAPLLYPNAIYNAASNYVGHRIEMRGMSDRPETLSKEGQKPYIFLKSPMHCTIGPGDTIHLPPKDVSEAVDWEAELGVVIGKAGRSLNTRNARSIVAGYTIFNDLSIRDRQRTDWPNFRTDWFTAKSFETSAPHGPWIVPAKQIPDPYKCKIDLWVNERHEQDAVAGEMIHNIEEQIEYISARLTMRPGDLMATGTTPGVGRGVDKGRFLKAGDTVRITISGIGTLENKVVAD